MSKYKRLHSSVRSFLAGIVLLASAFGMAGQTYRRILPSQPLSLEPSELFDVHSIQLIVQVAEGLTTLEGESVRPAVAQRWEISDDLTEYRFYLDPNARFSDGRPITSQDVIRSFENILRRRSPLWKEACVILGSTAFHEAHAPNVQGLQAVTKSILKIRLKKAFPPFLGLLASPNFVILPAESIASLRTDPVRPFAGSGPYEMVAAEKPNQIRLKKNRFYRAEGEVFFDEVLYDIVPNKELAVQGFLTGKYHDIWPYHVESIPAALSGKVSEIPTVTAFTWFLRMNPKNKILANPAFRKWFSQMISVDGFLKEMNLPRTYRAFGYIPHGFLGHREYPRKLDKKSSREILDASGCFVERPCKLEMVFSHDVEGGLSSLFQPLERFSNRLQIQLKKLPRSDWFSRLADRKFDLAFVGNSFEQYETYFCLRDLLNGFVDVEMPKAQRKGLSQRIEAALKLDLLARADRYSEIEDAILNQALIVPIYHGDLPYRQVRNEIVGYAPSILGYPYLKLSKLKLSVPGPHLSE